MENFWSALVDCGLRDLGFLGPKFTWNTRREGTQIIHERLDRCVGSEEWQSRFHYELCWAKEKDCSKLVRDSWGRVSGRDSMKVVVSRLDAYAKKLVVWNKSNK
ncbi:hypothetical protein QYF36_001441 [Acer negundo]|nr:hypothetical protein QYF36_001441 [Acer negundo]